MTNPEIVFENDDVVVVNKPGGVLVHEDGSEDYSNLVDWFLENYPESKGVGEEQYDKEGKLLERSGVVHRLDRDTSGVLILAKNQASYEHLKYQFQDRLAIKEYRALVYGSVREKWGTIERPIGRSSRDWRLRSAQRGAKGKLREAVTNWELISNGMYQGELFSYLKIFPKTGRTHQIRVHLKAIDHPVVRDDLYAGKKLEISNNLNMHRLGLHAHRLLLELPDGSEGRFIAPVPTEVEVAAERIAES